MTVSKTFLSGRVATRVGDITKEIVDAIVNAANSSLMGGGGVDGAIHRAGGPEILAACREIRRGQFPDGLPAGQAVITTGGILPARHVIHTVGPVYGPGGADKAELLAACYSNSLRLAAEHGLKTIAFPAISTGVYGYPLDEAAKVSSQAIEEFFRADQSIGEVRLVFFDAGDAEVFLKHHRFSE
jgi:O-acetyl-ADP-ribose deacetylase (regulator of RNase III)